MFKNDYQGGTSVEVFSIQGKDPLAKAKLFGPSGSIKKEYDKTLRTFILAIEGEPTSSKIIIPKQTKQTLHLIQNCIVFQIYLHAGRQFTLEVSLTDQANVKQRIILSSSYREIVVTALHAKMPCPAIQQNGWLNLCLHLESIVAGVFYGSTFAVLDSIVVSANCKLKRIFTLRSKPQDNMDIPRHFQLADECAVLQVLDMEAFLRAGINIRSGTGNASKRTAPYMKSNENSHIAFGTRYRKNSTSSDQKNNDLNKSPAMTTARQDDKWRPSKNGKEVDIVVDADEIDRTSKLVFEPRPPTNSAGKVRKPRIKSADYTKVKLSEALKRQPLSKSADTRCRRKISDTTNDRTRKVSIGSMSSGNELSDLELCNVQPLPTVKRKKSTPEFNDRKAQFIDSNIDPFKSSSLKVLPKIKSNHRYKSSPSPNSMSHGIEYESVFTESSSTVEKGDTSERILGDDKMIEDYLRWRTVSSGHDESSLSISSSCANSMNSDVYIYSSRPRSVAGHLSDRDDEHDVRKVQVVESDETLLKQFSKTREEATTQSSSQSNKRVKDDDETDLITKEFLNQTSENETEIFEDETSGYESKSSSNVKIEDSNVPGSPELSDKLEKETHIANQTSFHKETSTAKPLDHLNSFQMRDSCGSDTLSWLHASEDGSMSEKNETNKETGCLKPSMNLPLQQQLAERLGSIIDDNTNNDTDDGFSDCSDDTFVDPPTKFRNYRYQDEIRSIGSTLDLAATIPATPLVGDQTRNDSGTADMNNNSSNIQTLKVRQPHDEELLDLLFDPVLNCYYDPVTHKYYELS